MNKRNKTTEAEMAGLEDKLADDILMMIAYNFDCWEFSCDLETTQTNVRAAKLAAQGIARKLVEALRQYPGDLTPKRWQQMIQGASRNAIIEDLDGTLVQVEQNPSFVRVVAECTGASIAPVGSRWALAIRARKEWRMRDHFLALGLLPKEIN